MEGERVEAATSAAAAAAAGVTAAATTEKAAAEEPSAVATTTPSNVAAVVHAPPFPPPPAPSQDPPAPSQPHEAENPSLEDGVPVVGEREEQKGGREAAAEKATPTKGIVAATDAAAAPPQAQPEPQPVPAVDEDALLASFFAEVKSADRDAEVNRILGAFKLNPYEQLGVRFDADAAEVGRAYRKSSLLVHPDKCSHPRASDAFDLLGAASAALKDGAEGLEELRYFLDSAREQLRAERRKEAKRDGAARLAALVFDGGAAGVQAAWERSEQFHERWRALSRDLLARNEFKRRKLTLRLKETEERLADEAKAERRKAKTERKSERAWEKSREGRVGAWRDFAKKGGGPSTTTTATTATATATTATAAKRRSGSGGGGDAGKPLKGGVPSSRGRGVVASSSAAAAAAAGASSGAVAGSVRDPERSYVRRPAPGGEGF